MLKSAYGEKCLSRTDVFELHKRFKEAQKVKMQKLRVKTMLTAFFYAKGIVRREFVQKKQTENSKFYKDIIERSIDRGYCIRPECQESGSCYLLHDNAPEHSSDVVSEFLAKRGILVLSQPPYSPDLALADSFYFLN
jgi:hypothetical protein